MLHSTYPHRDRIDSRLLMVRSQTGSLTPGLSFDHNLCWKCPNGFYKAIFDTYSSRPFQQYKKHLKARCFDPCNQVLKFQESRRTKFPLLGVRVSSSHLPQSGVVTHRGMDKLSNKVIGRLLTKLVNEKKTD